MRKIALVIAAYVGLAQAQAPTIVSTTPAQNALDVPLTSDITVTFNQAMDATTIVSTTFHVFSGQRGRLTGVISWNGATNTATFDPDSTFKVGERVSVTLTTGIANTAGDTLSSAYVWNFTAQATSGTGVFAANVDYATGTTPYSVAPADLDGDGDIDLAVANYEADSVSVLLNNGDGTFAAKTDYRTSSGPISLTLSDLDGDGDADMVVANLLSGTAVPAIISVLKNNGDGTFVYSNGYQSGSKPRSVAAADLDGDGDADLAVVNSDSYYISVLMNNGNGTFATRVTYTTGSQPWSVTSADLDGDGDTDLAVANFSSTLSVLLNNGDGTFATKVDYTTSSSPSSITASDLDGDGDADLAVTNSSSNTISVLKNNGDGTFAGKVDYATETQPYSVAAADLDGDGDADLAVANPGLGAGNTVSILMNNGDGTFAARVNFPAGDEPASVAAADLNGDGDLDLAVANRGDNTVSVLKNRNLTPDIVMTPDSLAFGATGVGLSRSLSVTIENQATRDDLQVTSITPGTAFFSADLNSFSLAPGDCTTVIVTFAPADLIAYDDVLTIASNDPAKPQAQLAVSGDGKVGVIGVTPAIHARSVTETSNITASFSHAVDPNTLTSNTFVVWGTQSGKRDGAVTYNGGTNTATFNPTLDFRPGELVAVSLTAGVQNGVGVSVAPYTWTFTSRTTGGSGVMAPRVNYATGTSPYIVESADLDGDGDADLAVANYGSNNVSVLINNGDGTLAAKVDYLTGNAPMSTTLSDLDGDGDTDLAVANFSSNTVSVLKNNGDGTFAGKRDYAAGSYPYFVKSSDLDGDGDADLVVTNWSGTVSVLKNNGDGTFAAQVDYATGSSPRSVTVADLDGDGDADLAVANNNSHTVTVWLNYGDGTFSNRVDYPTGSGPTSITSSDLDGDGDGDLAVTGYYSDAVSVLSNNGDGTFAAYVDYSTGNDPYSVIPSDLDGDGDIDLAVANYGSHTVSVLKNSGDGTFAAKADYAAGTNPYSVTVADLDGDGDPDLAVANKTSNNVSVLLNRIATADIALSSASLAFGGVAVDSISTGTFTVYNWSGATSLSVSTVASSNDAVWANPASFTVPPVDSATVTVSFRPTDLVHYSSTLTVYSNDPGEPQVQLQVSGYGGAIVTSTSPAANEVNVALTDTISATFSHAVDPITLVDTTFVVQGRETGKLTGAITWDGATNTATFNPDLTFKPGEKISVTITAGVQSSGGTSMASPHVWDFNAQTTSGSGAFAAKADYATGTYPWSVAISDLDGDGYADLAVANYYSTTLSVLKNNGDGTFAAKVEHAAGYNLLSVKPSDVDADGDADLIVTSAFNTVFVLKNNGDGTFAAPVGYGVGSSPRSVTVSDLDGDGDADLAVVNYASSSVSVLLNNGDGTFANKVDYATWDSPEWVTSSDLDGDGDIDLAVAVSGYFFSSLSVLLNNGDGTFAAPAIYVAGSNPRSVTVSDLDGDGDADLAVANSGSNTVSVLLNNGDGTFAAKVDYAGGTNPYSVTVADLDGDGHADLAVANYASNTVSVLRNNGDGTFAAKVDSTTGTNPNFVTSSDLDGDGDADLVVTNDGSNTVSVLLNRGPAEALCILSDTSLAFGTAKIGVADTLQFAVSNPAGVDTTLQITAITSSDPAFAASPESFSVLPGDTVNVTVTFTPTEMIAYSDTLTVSSNDKVSPHMQVQLSGTSPPPAIAVLSDSLDLGVVEVGQSGTATLKIKNTATVNNLTISGIAFTNTAFAADPDSLAVPPGDSADVTVTFTPTETVAYSATMIIVSDDPQHSLVQVMVSGSGTSPPPGISALQTSLAFGSVEIGQSVTDTLAIINGSLAGDLSVTGIASSNAAFTVNPTTGTVPADDTLKVAVTFAPAAMITYHDSLTISSDDPQNPQVMVYVSGASPPPVLSTVQAHLAFGVVKTGQSVSDTLAIVNAGTTNDLSVTGITSSNAAFVPNPTTGTVLPGDTLKVAVTFTPSATGTYYDSLTVTSNDPNAPVKYVYLSASENQPPVAANDEATFDEDQEGTIVVAANDTDPDGHSVEIIALAVMPVHGQATVTSVTTITYVPEGNYFGADSFSYVAGDGYGGVDTDWVRITLNPVNDPPGPFAMISIDRDSTLSISSDVLDDSLIFRWTRSVEVDGETVTYAFRFTGSLGIIGFGSLTDTVASLRMDTLANRIHQQGLSSVIGTWTLLAYDPPGDTVRVTGGPFALAIDISTLDLIDILGLPEAFALHPNYPNPFNPNTTLEFDLPAATDVRIVVYDLLGREVARLADGRLEAGYHSLIWNGRDTRGQEVPTGIYIARLLTPEYTKAIKMVLLK